jgi:hypothetical protein
VNSREELALIQAALEKTIIKRGGRGRAGALISLEKKG